MLETNSTRTCLQWLRDLSQGPAAALIGKVTKEIEQTCLAYEIGPRYIDYYAEMPLLGESGVDLSAQYGAADFVKANLLATGSLWTQGELLHRYARELQKLLPKVVPNCFCGLETDSHSGKSDKAAVFLNISGNVVDILLPQIMAWQAASPRLEHVRKYLQLIRPDMNIWYFAFMCSREGMPIRFSLTPETEAKEAIPKTLRRLGREQEAAQLEELLEQIEATQMFDVLLDIDIMPDGNLGDTIGLEVTLEIFSPEHQQKLLTNPVWRAWLMLLQDRGLSDNRVELLDKCVFSRDIEDGQQPPYNLNSRISHFKFRWREGKPLPAKAYIQMRAFTTQGGY